MSKRALLSSSIMFNPNVTKPPCDPTSPSSEPPQPSPPSSIPSIFTPRPLPPISSISRPRRFNYGRSRYRGPTEPVIFNLFINTPDANIAQSVMQAVSQASSLFSASRSRSSLSRHSNLNSLTSTITEPFSFRPPFGEDLYEAARKRGFEPDHDGLVTFFKPSIPLQPVRGKPQSQFVDVILGRPVVKKDATIPNIYCSAKHLVERRAVQCMVVSDTINSYYRYFAMLYDDNTSLSYIPVQRVIMECITASDNEDPLLSVCITANSYNMLCNRAVELLAEPDTRRPAWEQSVYNNKVNVKCRAPHLNKLWTIYDGKYYETDVLRAIRNSRSVFGTAFIVVKYHREETSKVGRLIFEFHSMLVETRLQQVFPELSAPMI